LKEGHHFDQSLGGIAGFFDNLRSNTQGISNSNYETAKALKGSVLPTFERLHTEVKNKTKELVKGAGKGSKAVDKARNATQKHIELLGQHTATFDSTGGKVGSVEDPYILQRGVRHRLHRQVMEENANRQDILAVQNNFASFEAHIIETIQSGMGQFNSVISKQADATKNMYGDMVGVGQRIPSDFEWRGFLKRNDGILIDPEAPDRNVESISFPNQGHMSTIPLISGSLDRRSKVLRRYETNYFVVTISKYLHEFKTDDDFGKDPSPETSLYLPDCTVGAVDGVKFAIKGKDVSKGKLGVNVGMSHEYHFKAHTAADAYKWWEIIRQACGQVTAEMPEISAPSSPATAHTTDAEKFGSVHSHQQTGNTAEPTHQVEQTHPAVADQKTMDSAPDREAAHASTEPTRAATGKESADAAPRTQDGPMSTSAGPNEPTTTKPLMA